MEGPVNIYAILSRHTDLRIHSNSDVPSDACDGPTLPTVAGTLIKVFQTQMPSSAGGNKFSTVQILDFVRQDPIFENLYECPQSNLRRITDNVWPFLISIVDPERRHRFVQNRSHSWVANLNINDVVSVSGEMFSQASDYDCIIRYIGPVPELHPVGYFVGLELLNLNSGHSPQVENIQFVGEYLRCEPNLAIITTVDWIFKINELKKKPSPYEKVIDKVFGSNICSKSPSNTSSLRKQKGKKEATAQFYANPASPNTDETPPLVRNFNIADKPLSTEMERQPQLQSKANELVNLDGAEFKQGFENYEKNSERQHLGSAGAISQAPISILKHRRSPSSGIKDNTIMSKPLAIHSLEDRELVVIDTDDIRESTKNEQTMIVLNKGRPTDVDLVEILGNNWPRNAGDTASILNRTQKKQHFAPGSGGSSNSSASSQLQARVERNRSPNPLTHLNSTRTLDRNQQRDAQRKDSLNETSTATAASTDDPEINKYTNIQDAPLYDNLLDTDGYVRNEDTAELAVPADVDFVPRSTMHEIAGTGLGVGSMVEVSLPEATEDLYGVIRWIGVMHGTKTVMVGVELEEDLADKKLLTTNGSYNQVPLFKCNEGRGLFVLPERCANDKRFVEMEGAGGGGGAKSNANLQTDSMMFGQVECPSVPGAVAPIKILNLEELEEICGKFKGIQGHYNSCYLDATLFSMFTFTHVFDSLLFRPHEPEDIQHYTEVQKVLRDEIVNPLRRNVFVRADRVMKLRQLLDKLSSVSGLTSEEKDPEEFLNSLLAQIMRVEPFLKLSSGQDAFFYQLFVEKDERLSFPTVQQLFEQSFHSSDIKLKEVPSCLIIQMPRFGKNYKMYPRILPSQELDITDIIEDSPRQCMLCGKLAEFECRECFWNSPVGVGLEGTALCHDCLDIAHKHEKRANHTFKKLSVPNDYIMMAEHMTMPRLFMELFAVVCIETSHYVAFVKAGSGPDAPWCFFDSMADRKGEQNGYNIPEMVTVPDLPQWLSEEGSRTVNETSSNDKMLPEHAKRLFCDAYMCMYQSTDVMMYR